MRFFNSSALAIVIRFPDTGDFRLVLIVVVQCRGSENERELTLKDARFFGGATGQVNCRQPDKLIVV